MQRSVMIGLVLATPPVLSAALVHTPRQTEGPFYPDRFPLDTDNDLILINDAQALAAGEVTHLSGHVVDAQGRALQGTTVEIWQADSHGVYLHHDSGDPARRDRGFQGYGRFLTGADGEYYFRTIKPVAYAGRAPHIHFKVSRGERELLVTQCYVKGEPRNARDGILNRIEDPAAREAVIVEFAPLNGSKVLAARFDIVLGFTPPGAPAA